jgi:hypothetical protein
VRVVSVRLVPLVPVWSVAVRVVSVRMVPVVPVRSVAVRVVSVRMVPVVPVRSVAMRVVSVRVVLVVPVTMKHVHLHRLVRPINLSELAMHACKDLASEADVFHAHTPCIDGVLVAECLRLGLEGGIVVAKVPNWSRGR